MAESLIRRDLLGDTCNHYLHIYQAANEIRFFTKSFCL